MTPLTPEDSDQTEQVEVEEVEPAGIAPDPQPEKLMTSEEVADLYSVAPTTIRKWVREGKLEAVRLGKHMRFKRSEVIRFGNTKYGAQ